MIIEKKYITKGVYCVTKCKFVNNGTMIGSKKCEACEWFAKNDEKKQIVFCNAGK